MGTSIAARLSISVFLIASSVLVTTSRGQSQEAKFDKVQKIDIKKLMLVDGPYELAGAYGVFGFVVARTGPKATFRPCTGPMIDVDYASLKRTTSQCKDEAPSNGHPLSTACYDGNTLSTHMIAAIEGSKPNPEVGMVFKDNGPSGVETLNPSIAVMTEALTGISHVTTCGRLSVGLDQDGTDVMHFIAADDAANSDLQDLK